MKRLSVFPLFLLFGFSALVPSVDAAEYVGVLTGKSCAEKGELCPASVRGKEEVVLLVNGKEVYHLKGLDDAYLAKHFGHRVRVSGEATDGTIQAEKLDHLEVIVR
jgi:hypothetical protein